jgi:hypothetical protein
MENILPEFSKFYCHPGKAGGSPFWIRKKGEFSLATCPFPNAYSTFVSQVELDKRSVL